MKGLKMFLAWVLTVVVGSLLLPVNALLYELFMENDRVIFFEPDDYFLIVMISSLISALCSLPTIASILIYNAVLYRKKRDFLHIYAKIKVLHFLMGTITFIVGEMILFFVDNQQFETESFVGFLLLIIWYGLVAALCWFLLFFKENRSLRKQAKIQADNLLDE